MMHRIYYLNITMQMVNLYQDPDGENVFQKSSSSAFATSRGSVTKTERKVNPLIFLADFYMALTM